MNPRARADALVRSTLSLGHAGLRTSYIASIARSWSIEALAQALDALCERAEQAEALAREVLVAVVDALNGDGMTDVVQRLREQALGESLLALERLIRLPPRLESTAPAGARTHAPGDDPRRAPVNEASGGRTLTLGERKWLARRPDRETIERLLRDPHPDVIARCLRNPRIVEDDVVRLAAKRPGRGDVLAEIARSGWVHRPRVRLSLALNPATPLEIAMRIAGLLLRPELALVARSPGVAAPVRAVCLEHLERRPPGVERRAHGAVH
jgi:hypothetical protein